MPPVLTGGSLLNQREFYNLTSGAHTGFAAAVLRSLASLFTGLISVILNHCERLQKMER